ncbi:MAG: response regulator [Bacteroidota bacterium]
MFEKVLVAEDQEIANLSLRRTLEDLSIPKPDYAHHCESAVAQVRKALDEGRPYDLLVTDLYFEPEGGAEQMNGETMIKALKGLQPHLKVLVFSAEARAAVIQSLFDDLGIDGFVRKARGDAQELKAALDRITEGRRHYPREARAGTGHQNLHTFTDYDKTVIRLLFEGFSQQAISDHLETHGIQPSSLSSIEKRLNLIRTAMGFNKNGQLVVFCKEIGLI